MESQNSPHYWRKPSPISKGGCYILLLSNFRAEPVFSGWFDFSENQSKHHPSKRETALLQVDQWRREGELPFLTGNPTTNKPMPQRECAAGIAGACQMAGQRILVSKPNGLPGSNFTENIKVP